MPEIDCASDQSAILSDNYSQVVTGVGGCQASTGEIRIAQEAEGAPKPSGFRFALGKAPALRHPQKPVFSHLAECADACSGDDADDIRTFRGGKIWLT
ncbi:MULTISPECIES: hypothetical protein [unclassified Agrobacterium]|uniref:hypothetical protein n=1 Tax=unclassified Agrobacterium TaxID=2632611 RepID=UPI001130F8EA|nr:MULTISPECIES: hypothetical protein [unclassified Agrobacterium]